MYFIIKLFGNDRALHGPFLLSSEEQVVRHDHEKIREGSKISFRHSTNGILKGEIVHIPHLIAQEKLKQEAQEDSTQPV